MDKMKWPPLAGEYKVVNDKNRIAVVTLASPYENFLSERAAVVGSQLTENLGVEKIVCNTVSNPNIRALIICGKESVGHNAGASLYALWKNGIDKDGRIIEAKGAIPYLENIDVAVIERFREQILHAENLINVEDPAEVRKKIEDLLKKSLPPLDKPPLWPVGLGKRAEGKILSSGQKLIISEKVSIDPLNFEVQVR